MNKVRPGNKVGHGNKVGPDNKIGPKNKVGPKNIVCFTKQLHIRAHAVKHSQADV